MTDCEQRSHLEVHLAFGSGKGAKAGGSIGDVEDGHVAVVGAIHALQARVAVQELLLDGERFVGHQRAAQSHPFAARGFEGADFKLAVGGHLLVDVLHFAGHDVESAVDDFGNAEGAHPWLVAVDSSDVEGSTLLEVGLTSCMFCCIVCSFMSCC